MNIPVPGTLPDWRLRTGHQLHLHGGLCGPGILQPGDTHPPHGTQGQVARQVCSPGTVCLAAFQPGLNQCFGVEIIYFRLRLLLYFQSYIYTLISYIMYLL